LSYKYLVVGIKVLERNDKKITKELVVARNDLSSVYIRMKMYP
jgi:hypothetical protein